MKKLITYKGATKIQGPLLFLEGNIGIGYNEIAEIEAPSGEIRMGRVLESSTEYLLIEIFGGTSGLSLSETKIKFIGEPLHILVSEEMLGRIFNGVGKPIDGAPNIFHGEKRDINSSPINPYAREYPKESIQTGISCIDGLNTIVRGQKIPIFSGSGLPHSYLAAQIVRQATIKSEKENFIVVFAAMGLKHGLADFFKSDFEESGSFKDVIMIMNMAEDPSIERLITPRIALTIAEFFAYDLEYHCLVVLTDMTSYAEALREISASKGEIPSRKGYPGYLYTDLATIYERAGRIRGKKGTITQIPILTMPNDDIGHPIPDLTGYVTEGQIILSRTLHLSNVYPPIDPLLSLSRLMKSGVGEGLTREDHTEMASQLFASYARSIEIENLSKIIGEDELSELDKKYLKFKEKFIHQMVNQDFYENRTFEETLKIGWESLSILPKTELNRISDKIIDRYYLQSN